MDVNEDKVTIFFCIAYFFFKVFNVCMVKYPYKGSEKTILSTSFHRRKTDENMNRKDVN